MNKIFLVEDDEKLRVVIKENLEKYGFEVDVVKEYTNTLKEFRDSRADIVLMDINLPVFDGFHFCREIRSESTVPMIFLSSRDSNMDIMMAINMGGDDFITKPFDMGVLVAKIQALLRRVNVYSNKSNDIVVNGVKLKIEEGILEYNDKEVSLTKNDIKILHVLMKHVDKVVTREDIMSKLWDSYEFIEENTLTVNINRLRAKLKGIGIVDFIKTKKGTGYIIESN